MAAKQPTKGNPACCAGCDCDCCKCTCPYTTLATLIEKLKAQGVCPDVAAETASTFVQSQCC